ncbi:hypothetical protein XELAEV_18005375mg [Xenopus laevis]|uniref:Uncharacterized protein n=1 Tax=Xenopus laevis TaxID=8355 RepID=A0A974DX46_XENLA|nr:hypothetical protein XELAEV_18005375mg [Xenopus laevis]
MIPQSWCKAVNGAMQSKGNWWDKYCVKAVMLYITAVACSYSRYSFKSKIFMTAKVCRNQYYIVYTIKM